jgi:HEAT repeat protein
MAGAALGMIGEPALSVLKADLSHKDIKVRQAALFGLVIMHNANAIPAMTAYVLREKDLLARTNAEQMLDALRHPETSEKIRCNFREAINSLHRDERRADYVRGISMVGRTHELIPELIRLLSEDKAPAVRAAAAEVLGEIRESDAKEALGKALAQDNNEFVRTNAAWALGRIGDPSAAPIVHKASTNDRDENVRRVAQQALDDLRSLKAGQKSPRISP